MAVAYPASAVNFVPIPELHLALLAVARRDAFVPTLFAYKGQQAIALKPPYAALAEAATPQDFWAVLTVRNAAETAGRSGVLQQFDFVAVVGGRSQDVPLPGCLRSFFKQPNFEILAILQNSACGV